MYHKSIVQDLLDDKKISKFVNIRNKSTVVNMSLYQKIKKALHIRKMIIFIWLINKIKIRIKILLKRISSLKLRLIYFIFTGKIFKYKTYEKITQLSSGKTHAIIFFDELETKVHKLLYRNENIYTAQYPIHRKCNCNSNNISEKTILSPLSGWERLDNIPNDVLKLFYRDFKIILSKSGAKSIHLRPHPDFGKNRGSSYQIRDYHLSHGIKTVVLDCNKPISEIVCNYTGVAGFASAALRDARAGCNYAFVIGFTAVSRYYFNDPKFAFGNSEGIDWINEDGSYDPIIFKRKKYLYPKRQTVFEILNRF